MSVLSSFLNKFKGDQPAAAAAAIPAATAPPVPQGEWTLIVDKDCNVIDRPATREDFLARQPVAYADGGTLPEPKPATSAAEIPARVEYEVRAQKNRELLKKAVFLLSQTDDGRRLLYLANEKKFKFAFDPDTVAERNAVGLCDYQNKIIPLAEGRTPAEVALTLKHELQHIEDISNGVGYSDKDTPRSAIMVSRALEANARVSESVAAAELLNGAPSGPARQFRSHALFHELWRGKPSMAKAAQDNLGEAKKGNWKGFAQKVVAAFYDEGPTLAFYDNDYATLMLKNIWDIRQDRDKVAGRVSVDGNEYHRARQAIAWTEQRVKGLFTNPEIKSSDIAPRLTIRRETYMVDGSFDIGTEERTRFTMAAKDLFEKLKERMDAAVPAHGKEKLLPDIKPDMAPKLPPPANPYPGASLLTQEKEFRVIDLPVKKEQAPGTDEYGRASGKAPPRSDEAGNQFLDKLAKARGNPNWHGEARAVNNALRDVIEDARGTRNVRGAVVPVLEAGLLAPMAAFPPDYLLDLARRVRGMSENTVEASKHTVDAEELHLIRHWQELKKKGLDPVWGDEKKSELDQEERTWTQTLLRLLPADPKPAVQEPAPESKQSSLKRG